MDNVRKMTDTITKDGDKAIERVREVADSALEKGRQTWKELSGQGQDAIVQAEKSAKDAWLEAEKFVLKYPMKTVGMALFAGIAIGSLVVALRNNK